MYFLAKKVLFCFNPENAHHIAMSMLNIGHKMGLLSLFFGRKPATPVNIMGIDFPNTVGLAAGLDKNGDYFDALGDLGFGFIEIGTITPVAQPGNPSPRLFRLVNERAIINRMGFNNHGVEKLVANVKKRTYGGVLGINIGKNKATAEEDALSDYEKCMDAVYEHADYIAINVSSPNTPGLRNLQFGEVFNQLLAGIKVKQAELAKKHNKYVPVAVKIAPDMDDVELKSIADSLLAHHIDGVIATNTTVGRHDIEQSPHKDEMGGLSGAPLTEKSTQTIRHLSQHLGGKIPIIGVGGIMTGNDAADKIAAGASAVQMYSGFIFAGPKLVSDSISAVSSV